MDISEVIIVEASRTHCLALIILREFDGLAHDAGQSVRLSSVAGTLHGGKGTVLLFAEGGNHLLDPCRVIIAEVAQIACQGEDEGVARAMLRFAAQELYQLGYEFLVGDAVVFLGEHPLGCHSASILIISSRAEMRIINRIAITRLGRLNSRARRNSVIAVSARKSIVLNIVIFFTLNFEI